MEPQKQATNVESLRASNRKLSYALLGLIALLVVLGLALARSIGNERIVITPMTLERPFAVRGIRPSAEYLEELSLWLAHLMLDASPESIGINKQLLLKHAAPAARGPLSHKIDYFAERLKRDSVSTSFAPDQIASRPERLAVAIVGQLDTRVADKKTSSVTKAYLAEWEYVGGVIKIKDFRESELDDAFKPKPDPAQPAVSQLQ